MILLERRGLRALVPRLVLGGAASLRRAYWAAGKQYGRGARAICLTTAGGMVMIRHSYMPGWYIPGGGVRPDETQEDGTARELREEIGLQHFGSIEHLYDVEPGDERSGGRQSIFLVRDVHFEPALSMEVEAIGLFAPESLPPDTHP